MPVKGGSIRGVYRVNFLPLMLLGTRRENPTMDYGLRDWLNTTKSYRNTDRSDTERKDDGLIFKKRFYK